jgi:hypothetical protein
MARIDEVLLMLIPQGGWATTGHEYEGIEFIECEPITKAQFKAGFAAYDAWKAEKIEAAAAQRQAILDRLGLTAEEAAILLG